MTVNFDAINALVSTATNNFEETTGSFVIERVAVLVLIETDSLHEVSKAMRTRGEELGKLVDVNIIEKVPDVLEFSWQPVF